MDRQTLRDWVHLTHHQNWLCLRSVLLKLPPYAPELNPAENVWEYLRGNALSHQLWETYEAIVDACCDAWNGLMRTPDIVRSIATRKWAQVGI